MPGSTFAREKRFVPILKATPGSFDKGKRSLTAVISTNDVDRDGEIVEPSAFEKRIDTFKANPVVLWMHDPRRPPIGKVNGIAFHKDRVEAQIQFRPEGKDDLADQVVDLFEEGILSTFSIGFRVFEVVEGKAENGQPGPPRITDGELLEVSVVSVPANPHAAVKYAAKAALLAEPVPGIEKPWAKAFGAPAVIEVKAAPTPLQLLELAAPAAREVLDAIACGEQVSKQHRDAVEALRMALLRKEPAGKDAGDWWARLEKAWAKSNNRPA